MAPNTKGSPASVTQKQTNGVGPETTATPVTSEPPVNRKKQKRRQKQAARLAAEQSTPIPGFAAQRLKQNGYPTSSHESYEHQVHDHQQSGTEGLEHSDADEQYESRDDEYYSEAEGHMLVDRYAPPIGPQPALKSKKKKRKGHSQHQTYQDACDHPSMPGSFYQNVPPPPPPPPPLRSSSSRTSHSISKDRIWNTSTAEERERIKEFWLSLEETERRSLVKVEKEAVLKKMKEQQRNSCSCTICGRKRTAIEEELEVLYDAYYEELEQYANHQQIDGSMMPPPGAYPHMPRPRAYPPPHLHGGLAPKGRIMEQFDDDEGVDEEYSDEEDSEEGDYYDDEGRGPATEFFNFGNSLTVQGGILTVADDLLKNDGKKFIEMMEQLAERRMAREKIHSRFDPPPMRQPSYQDQGPPLDDEEDYEDDDADYDDSGDDYEDEEEMEAMSEEQRMEEGRRMFQIFAARMFEQRVLTAYREKVAKERQERLIEELNDEDNLKAQREAKKAKEAQKKKDKKKQQKAAKEEERLRKETEKAAELAAAQAIEEKKLEEQRQKREQQRKKKEAEKRAQEEEKQRKEAERQQRLREQQAESERKQKEQKDKEKKRKEEAKKKEREEREKDSKAKKEKEASEKREKDVRSKSEPSSVEVSKKEEHQKQPVPVVPSLSRKSTTAIPSIPPGLQQTVSNHASPHLQVATPVIPKAQTPAKQRQASQQGSHHSSPKSSQVLSDSSVTSTGSAPTSQPTPGIPIASKNHISQQQQQPSNQASNTIAPPPGIQQPQYPTNSSPMLGSAFGPNFHNPGMAPRYPGPDPSMYGHHVHPPPFRPYPPPGNFGFPPGINIPRQNGPHGRGSPNDGGIPQAPIGSAPSSYASPHSRQLSGSFERTSIDSGSTQPIARPTPIERPSSLSHQGDSDVDEMSTRLGSSALLDGTEDGPGLNQHEQRGGMAPGGPRPNRGAFGPSPIFQDTLGHARMNNFGPPGMSAGNTWGPAPMPMGTPAMPTQPSWSAAPGPPGWSAGGNFASVGVAGNSRLNPAHLRSLACRACRQLSASGVGKATDGFESLEVIMHQMQQMRGPHEGAINEGDLLEVLEAEGSAQNGGGSFQIQYQNGIPFAKYESNNVPFGGGRMAGPPGEIGSPIVSNAMPFGRGFSVGHHP